MTLLPEHQKVKDLDGKGQVLQDFLEWLDEQGIRLATYPGETEWMAPIHEGRGNLIARYFNIDLQKLDDEKRLILDELRAGDETMTFTSDLDELLIALEQQAAGDKSPQLQERIDQLTRSMLSYGELPQNVMPPKGDSG
jgi:hypothetical protein